MLAGLLSEPGRPRLTWYGPDGERVELSGAVLDNWVSKTVNLLVEEFDAGPGTVVRLDLPMHWRTVVWALAVWRVGGTVRPRTDTGADDAVTASARADVLVTDRPGEGGRAQTTREVVAVALPALARQWPGELGPGVMDAAQAVMTYGDVIGWAPEPDTRELALPDLPHGGLLSAATAAAEGSRDSARVLLSLTGSSDPQRFLLTVLGVLARHGSTVLVTGDRGPGGLDRIRSDERVDGTLDL